MSKLKIFILTPNIVVSAQRMNNCYVGLFRGAYVYFFSPSQRKEIRKIPSALFATLR
jgi:hypothetical protein